MRVKNRTGFVGLQRFRHIKLGRLNLRTLLLSFLYITLHNMVSVGFFFCGTKPTHSVNTHTTFGKTYAILYSGFYCLRTLSHLRTEETFIGPRGFKQARHLDKTSSTIKHGICNSTTRKMEMDLRENWALFKLTWKNYASATDIGIKKQQTYR